MKALHQIGLGLLMLAAAGTASAGHKGHDHHPGHGYKPGSYHHQQYTECKVTRTVTHNGRRYKEETICKAPARVHARHAPPPKHVYRAPPPPRQVHVVHVPPPPPAVVIGPHGVKVHGAIHIGW